MADAAVVADVLVAADVLVPADESAGRNVLQVPGGYSRPIVWIPVELLLDLR